MPTPLVVDGTFLKEFVTLGLFARWPHGVVSCNTTRLACEYAERAGSELTKWIGPGGITVHAADPQDLAGIVRTMRARRCAMHEASIELLARRIPDARLLAAINPQRQVISWLIATLVRHAMISTEEANPLEQRWSFGRASVRTIGSRTSEKHSQSSAC